MFKTRLKDVWNISRKSLAPRTEEYVLLKTFSCVASKMCLRSPQGVLKRLLKDIYKTSWYLLG